MTLSIRIIDLRPPRIAASLVLVAGLVHYLVPAQEIVLPSSSIAAGMAAVTGFATMLRAWWLFRLRGTAICPTATTTALITDDVFALSRNPMYLGMLIMLLALAINFGTLPFYVAAIAFFVILNFAFCPFEEQKLALGFGSTYTSYRNRVRRWL